MVSFMDKLQNQANITENNLLSITQPPEFILKILIIQARDNLKSAIEHYYIQQAGGVKPPINHVKSRLIGLFLEVRSAYIEYLKEIKKNPEEYEQELFKAKDFETLLKCRNDIDSFLFEKKLIKFDNIVSARPNDLADWNKKRGYG